MKRLLLILFISQSFSLYATEWKVRQEKHLFFLERSSTQSFQIISEGGVPQYEKEEKLGDYFKVLIYNAGSPGTSANITIKRAIVLNRITLKYLGDYPYEYVGYPVQPKWKVKSKRLTISDEETGLEKVIRID